MLAKCCRGGGGAGGGKYSSGNNGEAFDVFIAACEWIIGSVGPAGVGDPEYVALIFEGPAMAMSYSPFILF